MSADKPRRRSPERANRNECGVYLYWLPLGAGGVGFVRWNGRLYEAFRALLERRRPLDLYHTALEIRLPEGRFIVENAWPGPDRDIASRGVILTGPVFSRRFARFRPFRYEVRCWPDGVIADVDTAVEDLKVCEDSTQARHLLELVPTVPVITWGRDELGVGEMWNSNSVISYLLAISGIGTVAIRPPAGGRAPGWDAGLQCAQRVARRHALLTRARLASSDAAHGGGLVP
jgi:hypothetical protein